MRIATYRVPRASGDTEDGDVSVSQAGGSLEANIARWKGQFDPTSRAAKDDVTRKIGPLTVTIVDVKGNLLGSSMPGMPSSGPKTGWMLLGAIVEVPGKDPTFFKLTGPAATIESARGELDALVGSLSVK